jgi:hypothetical protein
VTTLRLQPLCRRGKSFRDSFDGQIGGPQRWSGRSSSISSCSRLELRSFQRVSSRCTGGVHINTCRWWITLRITVLSDFVHLLIFKKLENKTFRKLNLFPSSVMEETPTLLGPLEILRLAGSKGLQQSRCRLYHLRKETDPVSETLCLLAFRILHEGQSPRIQ